MRYKLVIFDWDGTVMDSVPKIVNTLKLAAESVGVAIPCDEKAAAIIGLSLDTAVATLFPNDKKYWPELIDAYQHQYIHGDNTATPLFNYAEQYIRHLKAKGVLLAVATGKGRAGLTRMLEQTKLGDCFITTRTADEAQSKPSPDMIHQILDELNIAVDDAVMIGDSLLDMKMAENAGIDAIAMSCGAASAEQLTQSCALAVCQNYLQLERTLQTQHVEAALCE
ncbi:HAD-IA family hydrolase [Pseudoalteromonas sp. JBTF-M23]|uniref:HAD-IA family hydrolase n=1 Tax=Pseudoalteromonas caenipelagi TaxID=2726988 RepID=A0A849V801_9GAMM|nr:HAD-IA family hydrolase [Pseudoalteromonas caenipelagi]NOU49462.1 HAD-IA family hydrolase [Pseudoalteromonas caenipelagi]